MRDEKGQVLIELALVLPLLLMLVFGIVDWGRALHAKNALANAARSGARVASAAAGINAESETPLSTGASVTAKAIARNLSHLYDTVPESLVYRVNRLDASGNSLSGPFQAGNQVQVIVTWQQFPMITPFNGVLAIVAGGSAQGNAVSLSGQAIMRYE